MIVPDDGPRGARIVLVGEAPDAREVEQGRPFVGPRGQLLMRWWAACGIRREDVYITNVLRTRPPNNKLSAVPRTELALAAIELHERLALLTDPYVIVPTGNTALATLTGHREITKHRGSIYGYQDRKGRLVKVIPTIHPAAVLWKYAREWGEAPSEPGAKSTGKDYEERCQLDWTRIVADSAFRELRLPQREYLIHPTHADALAFLADARRASVLAIDVETPRHVSWEAPPTKRSMRCGRCNHAVARHPSGDPTGALRCAVRKCACHEYQWVEKSSGKPKRIDGDRYLDCVGFSDRASRAMSLSLDVPWALDVVRQLCALPVPKAMQNGLFDCWWLAEYDAPVANFRDDSLCMHHCLHPKGDHDLAYLASIDTREPYWKDDHKTIDTETRREQHAGDVFLTYNCKDSAVTRELVETYAQGLAVVGKDRFYYAHYAALFSPLLRMSRTGIAVDAHARDAAQRGLAARATALIASIEAHAERPLTGGKGSISTKKLQDYLYVAMGLPKQLRKRASGKRTPSTDAAVLRKLALQFPSRVGDFVNLLLEHRQVTKLGQFLTEGKVDPDGRSRCRYKLTTNTLRLAAATNPAGRGMNHQNIPVRHGPLIRNCFVPEPGDVLVQRDLSQAEFRVVCILTDDPTLHAMARSAPWEFDIHCKNAATIFDTTYDEFRARYDNGEPLAKEQRYLAKRATHAADYGMAEDKLQEILLADGYVRTAIECRKLIDNYLQGNPAILAWQERVRHQVLYDRMLTTTWGWEYDFRDERHITQETYREAYADVPQHEVVMILNHWGLEPLDAEIQRRNWHTLILQQGHDSLLLSCPPAEAWDASEFLRTSLERPRRYAGRELTIPSDVSVGLRWGALHGWKRPPSRVEFEERIGALLREQAA